MLSHIPRGRTQAPHQHIHAYTPRHSQHTQKLLSIFISNKIQTYYNKKLWMHTLRSVHNCSCSLPANENSCDKAVGCPCRCMPWQAGPVIQTGAPAVFSMAGACCVAWMPFRMVVAPQGVGDAAVVMYTAGRSLWGPFAGPPSKVHAPWACSTLPPWQEREGRHAMFWRVEGNPSRLNSCWGLGAPLAVRCVQRRLRKRLQGHVDRAAQCLANSGGLLMVPRGGCTLLGACATISTHWY